ncbi:unnamed protein product, partial [Didymodactylos carnosus]
MAMRLLQTLYVTNPHMARLTIKRENFEFNKMSSLEIAIIGRSENFVGHACVQEVFDLIWTGDTPHKIKGKHFERMLVGAQTAFGQSTSSIQSKDQQQKWPICMTKMRSRLSRPRVKYQFHFVFYVAFLTLITYMVLFVKTSLLEINSESSLKTIGNTTIIIDNYNSRSRESQFSLLQTFISVWVFMFALEEFRQAKLFKTKDVGIIDTFLLYIDSSWNLLDTTCVVLYVTSVVLEIYNTKTALNAARAFLAIDVVLWYIRLLILLMIDRVVGPMLLMIKAMLSDMMTFFSIFFVFTTAYGVASFSLLKGGQPEFDLSIIRKIFHSAYWHVFGEINDMDEVK